MALKYKLASKAEFEGLPEAVRKEYVEKDGSFTLDVEGGVVPASEKLELQAKVAEFRDNNKKLFKTNEDLTAQVAKYEGLDPDRYKEMETEIGDLRKKGVTKPEDISQAIKSAVETATKPFRDQLEAEKNARIAAQQAADQGKFRELISANANKAGVTSSALRHVLREAESLFDYKDGSIVPKEGVKNPTAPLEDYTPDAWLQQLAKSDAYLFEPSGGGGAPGANGGGSGVAKPGSKILRNPSPEEMGANMDKIATGEIVVVRS